jgi:DNA-binding SARP family transcriptional activator
MGEFAVVISGRQLRIPRSAERVLTYLALADRPVDRTRLAGVLWRDGSDQGAAKSLRTTLWRIRHAGANLVLARDNRLRLYPYVTVDVTDLTVLAKRLILCRSNTRLPGDLRHRQRASRGDGWLAGC